MAVTIQNDTSGIETMLQLAKLAMEYKLRQPDMLAQQQKNAMIEDIFRAYPTGITPEGGFNPMEQQMGVPQQLQQAQVMQRIGALNQLEHPQSSDPMSQIMAQMLLGQGGAPMQSGAGQPFLQSISPTGPTVGFYNPQIEGAKQQQEQTLKQEGKDIESSQKLGTAVRRLSIIYNQFNEALPSKGKQPFEQRFSGIVSSMGAKTGIAPNPKLLALQKNIRPMAINLIRMFGEVGNLSQSEQQGAIDVVNQAGLTEKERIESVRQFAEFALAGASPKAKEYLMKQSDIAEIIKAFGIDVGIETSAVTSSKSEDDPLGLF